MSSAEAECWVYLLFDVEFEWVLYSVFYFFAALCEFFKVED